MVRFAEVCEATVANEDAAVRVVHGAVAYFLRDFVAENTQKPGKSQMRAMVMCSSSPSSRYCTSVSAARTCLRCILLYWTPPDLLSSRQQAREYGVGYVKEQHLRADAWMQ